MNPFYAKQTQFPKKSNESKYLFTNSLQKYNCLPAGPKQTQFKANSNPIKPNLVRRSRIANERKFNLNKGL
jgi:hypothetical protein